MSTTTITLTKTQREVLQAAINADGNITWFPEHLPHNITARIAGVLVSKGLAQRSDEGLRITQLAYTALGMAVPQPPAHKQSELSKTPRGTKQSTVIAMLQRPEGATIAQICTATGWQAHTVRGTFAGAFKKKLGLQITSQKAQGSERVYRLQAAQGCIGAIHLIASTNK